MHGGEAKSYIISRSPDHDLALEYERWARMSRVDFLDGGGKRDNPKIGAIVGSSDASRRLPV